MSGRTAKRSEAVVIAMALVMCIAPAAFAAPTITVSSAGSGVFVVQGIGMDGVSAMDIVLQYDATTLANPRVEQGSLIIGAMMAANPNVPGTVRIAIIRTTPVAGSGSILLLTFERKGSAPGAITGLTARLADINGKPLQASVQNVNVTEATSVDAGPSARQQTSPSAVTPSTAASAASPPAVTSGIVVQQRENTPPKQEEPPADPEERTRPARERVLAKADSTAWKGNDGEPAPPWEGKSVYTRKSVLDLFRDYRGERSPKALLMLFEQESLIGFRQEPAVAISDKKALVKVIFITPSDLKGAPDNAVMGGRLASLTRDPDNTNTWVAEVRPRRNAHDGGFAVTLQDIKMVFPLTLAPAINADLDRSGKVTEEDFALFLRGARGKKAGQFDLNADGAVNYLDDYIFTANYLVQSSKPGSPSRARK